ncbi:MAG: AAA family ATPase, partial [Anaerolineales bacterium]|nr:AAA family ATPase [Anaerolineales bacterium]
PGRGKTALVHEFSQRAQVSRPDLVIVMGNGQAYFGTGDPYLPFREVLEMLTGEVDYRWAAGSISQDHAHHLWQLTPDSAEAIVENGPALIDTFIPGPSLLSRASQATLKTPSWLDQLQEIIKIHQQAPPGPQPQQEDLFHQYSKVLRAIAHETPLLIFLDDLQWADRGTLYLLFYLGRQLSGARILIIGAFRPEEILPELPGSRHPLAALSNEFQILFGDIFINLDDLEGRDFVNAYLDSEPNRLGNTFRSKLYRQTRGHPLFTIELLRGMQERGELSKSQNGEWIEAPSIDWDNLPPKVEAAIGERLSRLPEPLWDLLQVASVEGEQFTAEVVAHVLELDEKLILKHLSDELDRKYKLVRAESTGHIDGKSLSRYRFHHVLVQTYLYMELDQVMRPHMHNRIGGALEDLYEAHSEEIAVQLAHHFQEANIPAKAIDYLALAGNRAVRLSANEEAITHFSKALILIETLPQTLER